MLVLKIVRVKFGRVFMCQLGLQCRLQTLRYRSKTTVTRDQPQFGSETLLKYNLYFCRRFLSQENVRCCVSAGFSQIVAVNAETVGSIELWVHVYDRCCISRMRKAASQTNRGGRFTAATLLIGQRNDFGVKQMHTPRATTSVEVISRAVYCYTSITVKLIFLSPDFGPLCAGCLIDSVEAASTAVCCYTSITLDFLISWP